MQLTVATLTKQTTKGLSTWSFVVCNGVYIGFGGCSNRCRTFRSMQQMKDCIHNFVLKYGYVPDTQSAPKPVKKANAVKSFTRPDSQLPVDLQRDLWALECSLVEPELATQGGSPVVVQASLF